MEVSKDWGKGAQNAECDPSPHHRNTSAKNKLIFGKNSKHAYNARASLTCFSSMALIVAATSPPTLALSASLRAASSAA